MILTCSNFKVNRLKKQNNNNNNIYYFIIIIHIHTYVYNEVCYRFKLTQQTSHSVQLTGKIIL